MSNLIILIADLIFIGYLTIVYKTFGIPKSISDTFYLFNDKQSGLGYVFTIFMFTVGILLSVVGLPIAAGQWWQFLMFICTAGLLFCGAAPMFKSNKLEERVHVAGASIAAVSGIIWCILAMGFMETLLTVGFLGMVCGVMAQFSNTTNTCSTFWWEIIGFGSIAFLVTCATL